MNCYDWKWGTNVKCKVKTIKYEATSCNKQGTGICVKLIKSSVIQNKVVVYHKMHIYSALHKYWTFQHFVSLQPETEILVLARIICQKSTQNRHKTQYSLQYSLEWRLCHILSIFNNLFSWRSKNLEYLYITYPWLIRFL